MFSHVSCPFCGYNQLIPKDHGNCQQCMRQIITPIGGYTILSTSTGQLIPVTMASLPSTDTEQFVQASVNPYRQTDASHLQSTCMGQYSQTYTATSQTPTEKYSYSTMYLTVEENEMGGPLHFRASSTMRRAVDKTGEYLKSFLANQTGVDQVPDYQSFTMSELPKHHIHGVSCAKHPIRPSRIHLTMRELIKTVRFNDGTLKPSCLPHSV